MKNTLARGGIEIIAVFLGISGGLWSEKQSELNKTLESEKTALAAIKESLIGDSTQIAGIVESIDKELINTNKFLMHLSNDTTLSLNSLNATIWDLMYFQYLPQDRSIYESQIQNAGKKIIQVDSVSQAISSVYDYYYKHLDKVFEMQYEVMAIATQNAFLNAGGYMDSKRFSITESLNFDQKKMFDKVLKNKKFISQVVIHYDTNFFIKNQYRRALWYLRRAIFYIEDYLNTV